MTWDVTIATHALAPGGAPDDVCLADALEAGGATTRFAVWNDPEVDWAASTVTVIRSTWDYHLSAGTWLSWLNEASRATRLVNPLEMLRWNTDKRYLLELAGRGVPIVPTALVDTAAEVEDLFGSLLERGWHDVVVKPTIGASASGAKRFTGPERATGHAHALDLLRQGAALVQPFQTGVLEGRERSLVMIGGRFSHAFSKAAFYAGASAGRFDVIRHAPTADELLVAQEAISTLPGSPAYARVDLVPAPGGPLLMELELIEPHLALSDNAGSAAALAEAVLLELSPSLSER